MDILVVGCGSIGQRHIKNLKSLGCKVAGCDKDSAHIKEVGKLYGIEVFDSLYAALERRYEGVFVCTPTCLHIPIAIDIAKKGMNLFIEKPLSNNLDKLDELAEIVQEKKIGVLVGCNTRFMPSFMRVKKLIDENAIGKVLSVKVECGFYLPYWHPYEDYRKGYSANKRLGGGVILDDIHEIDSLYWLFGKVKEVFCYADKISNLEIDTEDIAEIFLKFQSGVIAQIHLDYLQRTYRRYYEIIGEDGVVIWDYIAQKVEFYSKDTNQKTVFQESINTSRELMFINEVKHFIDSIKNGMKLINNITTAADILNIAMASYESAKTKSVIYL